MEFNMMGKKFLNADRPVYQREINLYFHSEELGGMQEYELVPKAEMTQMGVRLSTTVSIPVEAAQILMDDLYRCGIRPSDAIGTVGEKDALKNHLNDTRELLKNSNQLVVNLIEKVTK